MARPKKTAPSHRVYLTLAEPDHDLLLAFASELARPPTTVAGQFLSRVLAEGRDSDGRPNRDQIAATIRSFQDEPKYAANAPRWQRPISPLLAERAWWAAWYPRLCELFSRDVKAEWSKDEAVLTAEGYFDLLEFLFPTVSQTRPPTSWRSPRYAEAVAAADGPAADGCRPFKPMWEAVVRHTAKAMTAMEEAGDASLAMGVDDQIRHGWLSTLLSLVGEMPPGPHAAPKLPTMRLRQQTTR